MVKLPVDEHKDWTVKHTCTHIHIGSHTRTHSQPSFSPNPQRTRVVLYEWEPYVLQPSVWIGSSLSEYISTSLRLYLCLCVPLTFLIYRNIKWIADIGFYSSVDTFLLSQRQRQHGCVWHTWDSNTNHMTTCHKLGVLRSWQMEKNAECTPLVCVLLQAISVGCGLDVSGKDNYFSWLCSRKQMFVVAKHMIFLFSKAFILKSAIQIHKLNQCDQIFNTPPTQTCFRLMDCHTGLQRTESVLGNSSSCFSLSYGSCKINTDRLKKMNLFKVISTD